MPLGNRCRGLLVKKAKMKYNMFNPINNRNEQGYYR